MLLALLIVGILLIAAGLWIRSPWMAGGGAVVLLVLLVLVLVGAIPPAYR